MSRPSAWHYIIGLSLGALFGALIAHDFLMANYLHLQLAHHYILRRLPVFGPGGRLIYYDVPYVVSASLTLLLIGLGFLLVNLERLWRHRITLVLTLLIFSYQMRALVAFGRLDLGDLGVLVLLAIWVLHVLMHEERRMAFSPAFLLLLGLYGAMLLSAVNGRVPSLLVLVIQHAKTLIIFVVVAQFLQAPGVLRHFLKTLVVITAISSVIAILQEILFVTTGLVFVGAVKEKTIEFMFEETSLGILLRVPAFFGVPQEFANTLSVVSAITFYLLLSPQLTIFKRRRLLYLSFFLILAALVLTFSKGALLGFLTGSVLALYLKVPARALHTTAALAGCMLVAVSLAVFEPSVWRMVQDEVNSQVSYGETKLRFELAQLSLTETLRRHPWIGVGIGAGKKYTRHFFGWPAHNAFILALAEIGLVGFLFYCSIFGMLLVRLVATILVRGEEESRSMAKALLAGFAALFVDLQVDPFLHLLFVWIYWALLEGFTGLALRGRRCFPAAPVGAIVP